MSDMQDRTGETVQARAPGVPPTNAYVDLLVPGAIAGAKSRRCRLDRNYLTGLRDDLGGRCTFFLALPGTTSIQVLGLYDDLVKLLPA